MIEKSFIIYHDTAIAVEPTSKRRRVNMTDKSPVIAKPDIVVESTDLKRALRRFNDWQSMCLGAGAKRVPDETDRIHVPVFFGDSDVPVMGWYIHSVIGNAGGVIGVISVLLAGPVSPGFLKLEYTTHTEELRYLPL